MSEATVRRRLFAGAAVFAIVAFVAVLIATRHGPGLTPDSASYLSAAENLLDGHGYTDFTGGTLTIFPPGLPALLVVGDGLGLSLTGAARALNALMLASTVLFTFVLLRRHVRSPTVVIIGVAAVGVAPVLLDVFGRVLSETVFVPLCLLFVLALEVAVGRGRHATVALVAAAGIASAACLVRYAGAALILGGVLTLLLATPRRSWRATVVRSLGFMGLAVIAPGLWLLRNALSGAPYVTGPNTSSAKNALKIVGETVSSYLGLFAPDQLAHAIRIALIVTLLIAVAAVTWVVRRTGNAAGTDTGAPSLVPLFVVIVTYGGVVAASAKSAGVEISSRQMSALFAPTVVLVAGLVDRAVPALRGRRVALGTLSAVAVGWLVLGAACFTYVAAKDGGTELGEASTASPGTVVGDVADLAPDAVVASNDPWQIYLATDRQPVLLSPGEITAGLSLVPTTTEHIQSLIACGDEPAYLAWFGSTTSGGSLATPAELEEDFRVTEVDRASDGTLYELTLPAGTAVACD